MYDAVFLFKKVADSHSTILGDLQLEPNKFILATLHRQGNADDPKKLRNFFRALIELDEKIVSAVHPRTRKNIYNISSERFSYEVPAMLLKSDYSRRFFCFYSSYLAVTEC